MPCNLKYNILFFMGFMLCLSNPIAGFAGSDVAKEKRWAEQIVDSLMVGEAVWLEQGQQKFLGLFTDIDTAKPLGAAILVHGIGVHPNWPEVILPLRSELPDAGWATLSIQMPILENGKSAIDYLPLFNEVPGRINTAIKFLQNKGFRNIVIIAHSLGTNMVSNYLATNKSSPLRAYVGIGMNYNRADIKLQNTAMLKAITKIPVLDIYGSLDLETIVQTAPQRKKVGTKNNPHYQQIEVKGADHFFSDTSTLLVKHIENWLRKNAPGKEVKLPSPKK